MAEMKLCNTCGMEYDWTGVTVLNYEYCCEACSRGEECTCPQHNHQHGETQQLNAAAASQLGTE
ncbi:MAG: hypothetical protein K0Q72_4012 [Armatimonadetes bacterium]|jgi:hypothetical protein|nr:hypothetical protein [Armatimonadota bacterium]